MNIYEAVGLTWIIFTCLLSTVGIIYFAYVGVEISIKKHGGAGANEIPVHGEFEFMRLLVFGIDRDSAFAIRRS